MDRSVSNELNNLNKSEILRGLFSRFGLPLQIVSDNGPQFTSTEFEKLMKSDPGPS